MYKFTDNLGREWVNDGPLFQAHDSNCPEPYWSLPIATEGDVDCATFESPDADTLWYDGVEYDYELL